MIETFFMKELNETVEHVAVVYLKQRKAAILQILSCFLIYCKPL